MMNMGRIILSKMIKASVEDNIRRISTCFSNKDYADVIRWKRLHPPVVEIVSQSAITWFEHKVVLYQAVLEDLGHVEYVIAALLGKDQGIAHQLFHAFRHIALHEVVVGISSDNLVVVLMVQHRRVELVERDEIGNLSTCFIFDKPWVHHALLRHQEVANLLIWELNVHRVILAQMLIESEGHFWNVRFNHRSKAFSVRLIWKLVSFLKLCHGYICRLESELDVDKFLWVQVSVPVLCCCERCR